MVRVIFSGICGKMGKKIAALAIDDPEIEIVGGIEALTCPFLGKDMREFLGSRYPCLKIEADLDKAVKKADCVIEFTEPKATCEHVEIAKNKKTAMVIGTTGLDEKQAQTLRDASKIIPIVFSPNMSVGVNVLFKIAGEAAKVLGKEYDVAIEERHHVHKKDAPSGTAKKLAEIIKASKKDSIEYVDIKAKREGEIIGEHRVKFEGMYETIELFHSAKSRDVFAQGALLAAKFIVNKKPGLYTMADVLGIKD